MHQNNSVNGLWLKAKYICAFTDGERHLGHVVNVSESWHAYDATKPNETVDGFKYLGSFSAVAAAKEAVSESVARAASGMKMMHAGCAA